MRFCFDIDGTICYTKLEHQDYKSVQPIPEMAQLIRDLKFNGHYIILQTARHMKTCDGNVGKVIAKQGKILLNWLDQWNIPYDEIYFGKPHADYFIDDKAIKVDQGNYNNTINEIKSKL